MKKISQQLLELKEEMDLVGTQLNGMTWQRIERHMKEFALESCKEALKNASENALLIRKNLVTGDELEVFFWTGSGNINFSVSRQSILSETNIPKEVKQ